MQVLVTGSCGFIGFHTCQALAARGHQVLGIDSLNSYYDPALKAARLDQLRRLPLFRFQQLDISDAAALAQLFDQNHFDRVIHLAAQAGVRYSLTAPQAYISSNLIGFANLLECCRHHKTPHLVYASSSSVYGLNQSLPFSEHHHADHPVSLYAATKRANELMAHSYSHLYRIPVTGLRFFTVYGPWGRPDMAYWIFSEKILKGSVIELFNNGQMRRDFTYVDDVVEGVVRIMDHIPAPDPSWNPAQPDPSSSSAPCRVYNLGNDSPVELLRMVQVLERELGRKAITVLKPMQPGDVEATAADVGRIGAAVGFRPSTPIEEGLKRFCRWFLAYQCEQRGGDQARG